MLKIFADKFRRYFPLAYCCFATYISSPAGEGKTTFPISSVGEGNLGTPKAHFIRFGEPHALLPRGNDVTSRPTKYIRYIHIKKASAEAEAFI